MSLWLLIIVAIIVMFGITFMFIVSTKKAYSLEHKIDLLPKQANDEKVKQ
jgi:ABC-type maltose transport system permease subunit